MKKFRLLSLLFASLLFIQTQAQDGGYFSQFGNTKKWTGGLQVAGTMLTGDANNAKMGLAGGLHVKYSFGMSFGLQLTGNLGSLSGDREKLFMSSKNSDGTDFNGDSYNYTNKFKELDLTAVYTLGNLSFIRPLRSWQMYSFFGVGMVSSNATGEFAEAADAQAFYANYGSPTFTGYDAAGNETTNPADVTQAETSYEGTNMTIPFGFGLKKRIGDKMALGLELKMRWTNSDDIDAFNLNIPANSSNDYYHTIGVLLSFDLGKKSQTGHVDWINPMESLVSDMDQINDDMEELNKLKADADGDGVSDLFDKEVNDADCDKSYGNGVPIDSDGDGVPDCKDLEPFSVVKDVDENGVARDDDGDGVPNELDEEPNTPEGALVNVRGAAVNAGGACCDCNNVSLPSVIFNAGSSTLTTESYSILYLVAEKMKQCPDLMITATGQTSSKSGEQTAWKRANAIIDHLESNYGIDRSRVGVDYTSGASGEYGSRRIDLSQGKKSSGSAPPAPGM